MDEDNDTVPVTGRDFETSRGDVWAPTNEWLDAYEKQLTPKLLRKLQRFARQRVTQLGRDDTLYVRELVQDAVVDTWRGELRWYPDRCQLVTHLVKAIKTRTNKVHARQLKRPHVSIGHFIDEDEECPVSLGAEEEASAVVGNSDLTLNRVYAREVLAKVREGASADKDALRILDALQAGAETRDDVLALAKMRERTYHNAHIRLMRIAKAVNTRLAPKT